MEEDFVPSTNFIPCLKWVRRGVAKREPVKVELSKQELEEVIRNTKKQLNLEDNDSGAESDCNNETEENEPPVDAEMTNDDEFNLADYDNEDDGVKLSIGDIAAVNEAGQVDFNNDDADSDAEDDIIKGDDNLLVVGHVEGDASILEVYVYNENEDSFYVHHDIILPSIPLALEWLNYDPDNVNRPGNLCAIGSMSPIIEVWDLDLVNCLESAFKLGKKGSKRKGIKRIGHRDAVLDLSWNISLPHILASGSVDKTILLWDLELKEPNTSLPFFQDKVQSLQWHPFEGQTLLAGSSDKTCKVIDGRVEDSFKSWSVNGEVEKVLWNHFNPFTFFCCDDQGYVHCFDCRQEAAVSSVLAHSKEVTGLSLSSQCPGFLATASQDNTLKVWDVSGSTFSLVSERDLRIGDLYCIDMAPDAPFLIAAGGNYKSKNLMAFNANQNTAVSQTFSARELATPVSIEGVVQPGTSSGSVSPLGRNGSIEKRKPQGSSLSVIKKKKFFKN